jgi:ribokinase
MLVVFGAINVDTVFPVSRLPLAGDAVGSGPGWDEPGGRGANQAVAAARDGACVELLGAVGEDALATAALARLAKEGIGLRGVARHPGRTGRAAICVMPDGRTTKVVDEGANLLARTAQVGDALLGPRTTLLLQMDTDAAENAKLIARARRLGTRIVLHLAPAKVIDTSALRSADVLIGNSNQVAWLGEYLGTGNNPASIRNALGVVMVRMMSVQGAEAAWEQGYLLMPACPIEMRDTTAASDCFVGVMAAALDRGAPLPQAMRRAGVAAALSVHQVGVERSMPTATQIEAALAAAPHVTAKQPEIGD